MRKIKARFMADYCSTGMWVFKRGVWINIETDFLSEHLQKLINDWQAIYDIQDLEAGLTEEGILNFDNLGSLILQIANEEIGNKYDLSLVKYDD